MCCAIGSCRKPSPRSRNGNAKINELVMEKKEEPMRFFARVDKIVVFLGSPGVYLPVEDMSLKIVEVLTDDYEFEQRTTSPGPR